jgi:hypothetical protein
MATSAPLTVGFALDVSGSMEASIQNVGGKNLSRLEGLQKAMDALLAEATRLAPLLDVDDEEVRLRVFACVYGLKLPGVEVCDLFRLVDVLDSLAEDPGLNATKQRLTAEYERRLRNDERAVAIEVMGSDAYSLLRMSRAKAEQVVRERIEQEVRKRLRNEGAQLVRTKLEDGMRQSGAVVLTLGELTRRWEVLRTGISGSNEFLGGSTPMRHCMEMIEVIFAREMSLEPTLSRFILFVASDGVSMDGDPREAAARLRRQGVQVISCFVSSTDIVQGKKIYSKKLSSWPSGAQTMFDIASRVSTEGAECRYLEGAGWKASERSGLLAHLQGLFGRKPQSSVKLFAQVNHSSVLDEFLRTVLAPLYAESRLG